MVSIIMLSYNASLYTKHALRTLKNTEGICYEIIVLDNNSKKGTKKMLQVMKDKGYIDKLVFEKENTLFAKGNNIASSLCDEKSNYILLLNSDIEIRDKNWLKLLLEYHKKGATAYGVCDGNPYTRGDGYCFLIDKDLYLKYKLDENFEWWWSVTKLQAQLLKDGYNVTAIRNHMHLLYHYGGASGDGWRNAKGINIEGDEVKSWFDKKKVKVIEVVNSNKSVYNKFALTNILSKINNILTKLKNIFKYKILRK